MNPDSVPSASSACYAVLQYFDQISEAPDAITCLRRLILDLAVRGKLVEQVPNEEPTSKLLKRIEEENSRLFKEGAIRVQQPLPPIEPRDIAFEIPKTWKWVQIETIAHVEMGQSPSSEFYNQHREGLPFYQGKADFGKIHPTPRYWCTAPTKLAEKDDILISVRAPVGPTNIATEMCCIGRGLAALRPYQGYERDFFLICLKKFAPDLESLGAGTTFVAIGRKHLVTFIVPLPPLAEQRRIVAKVDELRKLCDELEATQQKRERLRDRLITASLTKLTDERENKSILNFSVSSACSAVSRPEHIHQLRQTILNLAVRGKLATQDPNDEPAEELLRRIETEKQRLISEGIIKKVNPLSPVLENEHPFELPQSWLWERFGNIATIQSNLVKPQDYPNHPHIAPDNIESKTGKLLPYVTVAESRVSSAKHLFFPKNIIYSKIRPNLAKAAVVDFEGLCSADAYPIYSLLNIQYLLRFMLSEVFIQQSVKEDNRVAMPKINQESLNKILVAVPPLAEQHRIVEKVDELMAICDELETRITKTKNTQHQLLEATLYEAIEGQRHQI